MQKKQQNNFVIRLIFWWITSTMATTTPTLPKNSDHVQLNLEEKKICVIEMTCHLHTYFLCFLGVFSRKKSVERQRHFDALSCYYERQAASKEKWKTFSICAICTCVLSSQSGSIVWVALVAVVVALFLFYLITNHRLVWNTMKFYFLSTRKVKIHSHT